MANAIAKAGAAVSRLREILGQAGRKPFRLVRQAAASRRRLAATVAAVLLLTTFTSLAWMLLVKSEVDPEDRIVLGDALVALDAQQYDQARALVEVIRKRPASAPEDYGGTAFVLGAIRAAEADQMAAPERRKAAFYIASTYLQEAAANGFPAEREAAGWLLLAQALMEAQQYAEAIPALERALELNPQQATRLHRLLAWANLQAADGDLAAAKKHNGLELSDRTLAPHERAAALLRRGEILLRLGEVDEVDALIQQLPAEVRDRPAAKMLRARRAMAQADRIDAEALPEGENSVGDSIGLRRGAIELLRELQAASSQESELARSAQYLIGQCYSRLPGELDAALDQLSRLAKLHPESDEGLAASLAEAELLHQLGRNDEAVAAYARTLKMVGDPTNYHNRWLPLASLRARVLAVIQAHVESNQFETALLLIDQLSPTFDRAPALEQQARVHRTWGEWLLKEAAQKPSDQSQGAQRLARQRFRQAGQLFEELSTLRLAEPEYADDLWRAAENYLDGQCASQAVRILSAYLDREAVARRPQALVQLGKAHLTSGDLERAIAALEECIELYDRDAAVYDARILCATAYIEKNDIGQAERFFRANLSAGGLTPASREWRESLLGLGQLFYSEARYTEAIPLLQEYVERYGAEPEALFARYLVAQSNRRAAQVPLDKLAKAITENERIKHRTTALDFLKQAIDHFSFVQRELTLKSSGDALDPLEQAILRNCYLLRGDVLFSMREYDQALDVFRNASSLYQNDPIALNAYLQIAWCHRRLDQLQEARGAIEQAKMVLARLPQEASFSAATGMDRQQWTRVLNDISQW